MSATLFILHLIAGCTASPQRPFDSFFHIPHYPNYLAVIRTLQNGLKTILRNPDADLGFFIQDKLSAVDQCRTDIKNEYRTLYKGWKIGDDNLKMEELKQYMITLDDIYGQLLVQQTLVPSIKHFNINETRGCRGRRSRLLQRKSKSRNRSSSRCKIKDNSCRICPVLGHDGENKTLTFHHLVPVSEHEWYSEKHNVSQHWLDRYGFGVCKKCHLKVHKFGNRALAQNYSTEYSLLRAMKKVYSSKTIRRANQKLELLECIGYAQKCAYCKARPSVHQIYASCECLIVSYCCRDCQVKDWKRRHCLFHPDNSTMPTLIF